VTKTGSSQQYEGVGESDVSDSFDQLYAREFAYVWRTVGRLGVPPADIADAVHDVFVVVYQRWDELDPARPARPWLFGIARRVASASRRKQRPGVDAAEPALDAPPHADRDLLWHVLGTLSDERREVLVLHDLEGYTGTEIAALLELSPNTVHSRLRLAREDAAAAIRRLRGAR
jgi:RNA polymerase sigma-70 factor (ECF subfamily)